MRASLCSTSQYKHASIARYMVSNALFPQGEHSKTWICIKNVVKTMMLVNFSEWWNGQFFPSSTTSCHHRQRWFFNETRNYLIQISVDCRPKHIYFSIRANRFHVPASTAHEGVPAVTFLVSLWSSYNEESFFSMIWSTNDLNTTMIWSTNDLNPTRGEREFPFPVIPWNTSLKFPFPSRGILNFPSRSREKEVFVGI